MVDNQIHNGIASKAFLEKTDYSKKVLSESIRS